MSELARKIETARERLCEAFADYIGFEKAGWYAKGGERKQDACLQLFYLEQFRKQADEEAAKECP